MPVPPAADQESSLARVIWIGGSPCAGKTTLALSLARRFGLAHYSCDNALAEHLRHITPATHPMMVQLSAQSWDELWTRPVDRQIVEEVAFYREEFPLILADLRALPESLIVAEGTALLPELVAPLLPARHRAIWLLPTAAFQRDYYARRPWIADLLNQCADPSLAFDNWMRRDSGFADLVERDARSHGLITLRIDGTRGIGAIETWALGHLAMEGR